MEEQEKQSKKNYIPAEQEVIESNPEWMVVAATPPGPSAPGTLMG